MTAAAFHPPYSSIRDATRRLALALSLSAIAHLLLARSLAPDATPAALLPAPHGALTVRIEPAPPGAEPDGTTDSISAATPPGRPWSGREVVRTEADTRQETVAALALPRAPDPTYYSARDLDSYPRLTAPLDLDRLGGGAEGDGAANFRFQLSIDERGVVNEISTLEGEPPQLREALRTLLAATQFVPAQKDGRPVKSRVTLSVGLDAARRKGAGR